MKNILTIKVIVIFLNLFLIIILTRKIIFENLFKNNKEFEYIDANLNYLQTKGEYPGFINLQLNYEKECSKYFKYKKNSERDIVIFAYTYRPAKNFFQLFDIIIDSFKHSVPRAIIASVIPQKDKNSKGAKLLEKYGIKLIPFESYEDYSIVTSRYIAIYNFLKNNSNIYLCKERNWIDLGLCHFLNLYNITCTK